ncbi:hypothetical protein EJ05DRAFT_526531 [Pseudovirgaria hyperparasitica]|uniref:Rhodopsin domain-containing protein n=1 Tax=Pseudovirgaria hyperparasitica TaxID=470096 RepID=A0A6A6WBA2_9PEZI|nr:uncharacterized protein EJ05DRAFT_526531 [Pseudovirgaria hyperparasitica]KAF2759845.1 hypothetical protein EJ05DRAFT_526531 [Pseudovirgaria hyperparasitica]
MALVSLMQQWTLQPCLHSFSLCFAKLSMAAMIYSLTPKAHARHYAVATAVFVAIWALTSGLVLAFECDPPRSWDYIDGKCINSYAARVYIETANIFTEVALMILPCPIIAQLNMPTKKRISLASTFFCRTRSDLTNANRSTSILTLGSVIGSLIAEIVCLGRVDYQGDRLYTFWPVIVCQQFAQFTCIVSTCVVYLRPFVTSLESGFIRVDDARRRGESRLSRSAPSQISKSYGVWSQQIVNKHANHSNTHDTVLEMDYLSKTSISRQTNHSSVGVEATRDRVERSC